ncbi:hypothetical protein OIE52_35250 [Streptomyces canus]|uniref:hypothetical protein n=1 Tax=Streptomyces canus TaxID=58343 RepID=UPI002E2E478D|nr:hypothetical protein [Streptomyces canus]
MNLASQVFALLAALTHLVTGAVALRSGEPTAGRTLILYLCAFLVAPALALAASFPRLWRGALGQGLPPALPLPTAAR